MRETAAPRASGGSPASFAVVDAPSPGSVVRRFERLGYAIAATDTIAIVAAFLLAYVIRFGPGVPPAEFALVIALVPPVWLAMLMIWRLYAIHRLAAAEEFRRLVTAVSILITIVATLSFWSKSSYSRVWIGLSWVLSVLFVVACHQLWHGWIRRRRARHDLLLRTLVVGTNQEAEELAHALLDPQTGFEPVGYVESGKVDPRLDGLPIVATLERLREGIERSRADCLFVASTAVNTNEMRAIAKMARKARLELRVSANLPEMLSNRIAVQPVGRTMALTLQPVGLSTVQAALKRFTDVVTSGIGLLTLSPLLLAIAAAVKLSGRGPVVYRQIRVGRRGGHFSMLKFRTMVHGADEMVTDLRDRNEASAPLFKIHDDPRVTRVGRFFRRWSLDELPQLWNVIRGDMSLVGPRPPLPDEVAAYADWHTDRLEVRPGITGLWQVSGRSDVGFDDSVTLDLFYIENWSLTYDLYILLKTVPAVLGRKGSY